MDEYITQELQSLVDVVAEVTKLDDETISNSFPLLRESIEQIYNHELKEKAINQLVTELDNQRLNRKEAAASLEAAKSGLIEILHLDELTTIQREAVDMMLQPLYETFDEGLKRYHLYNIELPIKLEKNAQVPTYAHDTDAAADLYALEDVTLDGNTKGNKIHTGVSIQLPEGWLAMILPRSSMGAKTPLRLSNSVGLIDSGYRGELGVLYDNISDVPYEIKAGDRIAQLLVMPSYRFQAKVVESLEDSDRGEGGFGSTGV